MGERKSSNYQKADKEKIKTSRQFDYFTTKN